MSLLALSDVTIRYGRLTAVRNVALTLAEGEVLFITGPNGAGKSSLLRAIAGVTPPAGGRIDFADHDITGRAPEDIARLGLSMVPEGRDVFASLTIEENLRMGAFTRSDGGVGDDLEMVYSYFPILKERFRQQAGYLSGGQQQMLAIGRGLMARPRILLLDEPSLGLSPLLVQEIFTIIRKLNREQGVTMMLVEQNAQVALKTAHYGYVLEIGRIVMNGEASALMASEDIQEFYLGVQGDTQRGQKRWKRRKTWR